MNYGRGFGFIEGLVLGGLIGAAVAVLTAPASGVETRNQLRAEGVALKQRGQNLADDTIEQAQKLVKQGQDGV